MDGSCAGMELSDTPNAHAQDWVQHLLAHTDQFFWRRLSEWRPSFKKKKARFDWNQNFRLKSKSGTLEGDLHGFKVPPESVLL